MITVLAIDPGRTTGFCRGTIEDGEMILMPWQEAVPPHLFYRILQKREPDILVIEKFEFRKNSTEGLDLFPKELIGVARLYAIQKDVQMFEQNPSYGMGYYNDMQLKTANVYVRGIPHAMDAQRHLLHWFTFGAGFKYNTTGKQYPFKLIVDA